MGRSWWGWGTVEDALTAPEVRDLESRIATVLPGHDLTAHRPPEPTALEDVLQATKALPMLSVATKPTLTALGRPLTMCRILRDR